MSFAENFKQQDLNRDILIKASYFYNLQRYDIARDLLQKALKGISYPEDLYKIRYMYAKTMFQLYNFSAGVDSLENILFISPDKYEASFLLKRLQYSKTFERKNLPQTLLFTNAINGFDYKNNIEYFYNPISVTISGTHVFAIDPANNTLIESSVGGALSIKDLSISRPFSIASINNNIFILDYGNKIYNLSSGASITLGLPILMKSYDNKLWVYDMLNSSFYVFNANLQRSMLICITSFPYRKILVKDFVVDSYERTFYVLDETSKRIEKFDFSGRMLLFKNFTPTFTSKAFSPQSIDIDRFGNIYVSSYDGDVIVFDTNLNMVETFRLKNKSFSMCVKDNYLVSSDYIKNTLNIYQILYKNSYLFPKIDYVDVDGFPKISVYMEIYDKFSNPFPQQFGYLKLTDNKINVDYTLTNLTYYATNVLIIGDDLDVINKFSDNFNTIAINKSDIIQSVLRLPFNPHRRILLLINPNPTTQPIGQLAYFLFLHNISLYVLSDSVSNFYNTLTRMTGGKVFKMDQVDQLINYIKSKRYNMMKLEYTTPFVRQSLVNEIEVDFKYQNFISMDSIIYSKNWRNEVR